MEGGRVGVGVSFSLHNLNVVGSSPGGALAVLGHPLSAPLLRQSYQRPWCVVPCLWDIAHKRYLAILRKEQSSDPGGRFLLYIYISPHRFDHQRLNKFPTLISP